MIFKDDIEEVTSTITIHIGDEMINVMKDFAVAKLIIIKCCMMFNSKLPSFSSSGEDEID
jgi:hypothetical protein